MLVLYCGTERVYVFGVDDDGQNIYNTQLKLTQLQHISDDTCQGQIAGTVFHMMIQTADYVGHLFGHHNMTHFRSDHCMHA